MAKKERILGELRTCQPVDYKESAIRKALEKDAQLLVETEHGGVELNIVVKPVQDPAGKHWEVYFLSRGGFEFEALKAHGATTELQKLLKLYGASAYNGYRKGFMIQGSLLSPALTASLVAGVLRKEELTDSITLIYSASSVVPFDRVVGSKEPIGINRMVQNTHVSTLFWGLRELHHHAPHIDARKDSVTITLETVKQSVVYRIEHDPTVANGLSIPSLEGAYEDALAAGHEGLTVWRVGQPWHRGKKTGGWVMKTNIEE